jgi:hypothetical protein
MASVSNLLLIAAIVCCSPFGGLVAAHVNKRSLRVSSSTRSTSSSFPQQHSLPFDVNREHVARCKSRNSLSSSSLSAQSTYNSDDSRVIAPPATNQNLHRPMKVMGEQIRNYSSDSLCLFLLRNSSDLSCYLVDMFKLLLFYDKYDESSTTFTKLL